MSVGGTKGTKEFYEGEGWAEEDGVLTDTELFGDKEMGPVRLEMKSLRDSRIVDAVKAVSTDKPTFVECGCGGTPEVFLTPYISSYTGVDFSTQALKHASKKLESIDVDSKFVEADICNLPFSDGEFDVAYSAHVLYHIADKAAQRKAFREIARIVKPGGISLFVLANPRPLLFPLRLLNRIIADTPVVSSLLRKLKSSPIPYAPLTIGTMRRELAPFGEVSFISEAIASTWINHNVSETSFVGRLVWKFFQFLEKKFPKQSLCFGNYVLIELKRK